MAYIPPSEFSTAPTIGVDSIMCDRCGYSLQGLSLNTLCPECGAPTSAMKRRGSRFKNLPLSQMPERLIQKLALHCFVAALVLPIVAARLLLSVTQLHTGVAGIVRDSIVVGLWILAVTLLTKPINDSEAIRRGFGAEGKLRKMARWFAYGGIGMAWSANVPTFPYAGVVLVCMSVVTLIGVFCLLLLLVELADWVRDTRAKRFLEVAAWGPPILFLGVFVLYILPLPSIFVMLGLLLVVTLSLGSIFGMMFLASSVLQAATHSREYHQYLERRVRSKDSAIYPTPE